MEENRKGRGTIGRAAVERSRAGLVQSTVAAVTEVTADSRAQVAASSRRCHSPTCCPSHGLYTYIPALLFFSPSCPSPTSILIDFVNSVQYDFLSRSTQGQWHRCRL